MEFKLPKSFEGVRIFSSEITDGPMNRLLEEGRRNAPKFLRKIRASKPFSSAGQPHRNLIKIIEKDGFYENADGLLTRGDYVLGVKTADCIPLLLFSRETCVIGAVHLSRKNLISGMVSKSFKENLKKLKVTPLSLKIFLAPHIRWPHYEIKKDICDPLRGTKWERFIKSKNSKNYFDLTQAAVCELEGIGVLKDNIHDSKVDTYLSDKFYSARRGQNFVFLTLIFKK